MRKILRPLLKKRFAIFFLAVLAPSIVQAQSPPNSGPMPVKATFGQILDLVYSWKQPEEIDLARLYETYPVPSCTDTRCSMRGLETSDGYKIDNIDIIVLKPGVIDRIMLYLPQINTCATLSVAKRRYGLKFEESRLQLSDFGAERVHLSYERKRGGVAFYAQGEGETVYYAPLGLGPLSDMCMSSFGTGTID